MPVERSMRYGISSERLVHVECNVQLNDWRSSGSVMIEMLILETLHRPRGDICAQSRTEHEPI